MEAAETMRSLWNQATFLGKSATLLLVLPGLNKSLPSYDEFN